MSTLYCNQCQCDKDFLLCDKNVKGGGYSSLQCDECQYKCVQCHECKAVFSCMNSDFRYIKKHIKNKHGLATTIPLIDQSNVQTEEPTSSPLSIRATYDRQCLDVLYEEDVEKDTEATSFDAMDESENFLNIELHESFETLARSFTPENVSLDARNYPNFGNDTSNTYFEQDFKMYHEEGQLFGGMRGVCWRSRYKLSLHDIESIANMDDAKFMLNITKLLMKSPTSSNELLYEILAEVTNRMEEDFDSANPDIKLPRCQNDAVQSCLHGQHGIFNNLPSATVHDVGGHACMKIGDVIAQHMAQGRGFEFTETPSSDEGGVPTRIYSGIHGCLAMTELINKMKEMCSSRPAFYGWFTTWSDSFLRSYVKQKLNNVWMYTITLPDPNHNATSPYHTYCVAVGAGALDHTPVIDWYSHEIEELMKGKDYYCGLRRDFVHAKLGVVAALADRPEKAFTLKTALLGVYGQIASWAAEIVPDVLADCNRCFLLRCKAVLEDRHSPSNLHPCNKCCQWDLKSNSKSVEKVLVPDKYPTTCDPNSPSVPAGRSMGALYIAPVKQSFVWLTEAVRLAAHNVTVGVWNKGVMDAYLRTCSVAGSVCNNIWSRCRPQSGVVNNEGDNVVTDDDNDMEDDGEIYDGYRPLVDGTSNIVPSIWFSTLMMSAYLDCGMHLVFHGIVAYCVERMDEFMADHGLTQKFERLANAYLLDIQSHRLDWCKMKYFPKKQWLAENELALARIIPFVYGMFFLNFQLPARCNTTKKTEMAIMQMFHSMHVMISVLMSPRDPLAEEVDEHVKIFLSCCHRFSRSYYSKSKKPFWANTGNFPTLLCLADQRRRHGPIRWYWEGTSERFIQKLKRVLISMRKTTQYFSGKLTLMHKSNVMEWLSDEIRMAGSGASQTFEGRSPRMYYQYKTLEEIERRMSLGEVVSGFTFEGNGDKIIISYGERRRSGLMSCIEVQRLNKGEARKCVGLAYVKCQLDKNISTLIDVDVETIESRIEHHCLMLPLVDEGLFVQEFAIVYDDWDVGNEYFKKVLPSLCPLCFATDVLSE